MSLELVVGSLTCSEGLLSGYFGFPLSLKTNTSKFQFYVERTDMFQRVLKNSQDCKCSVDKQFIGLQVTILPLLGRPLTLIAVMGCSSRDGSLFIACEGGGGFGAKRGEI